MNKAPHVQRMPKLKGKRLLKMLSYMRPAFCETEERFIDIYLDRLGMEKDKFGNRFCRIGSKPVLWSSHTDTVHKRSGRQKIRVTNKQFITLSPKAYPDAWVGGQTGFGYDKSAPGCLGADDTAGVWLMTEMIRCGVEGLYVFHREEERGCKGSRHFRHHSKDLLEQMDCAIAFDRRGFNSVITRSPNCSDEFAESLCEEIGGDYKLDPGGIYTDTCIYDDVIPECTNVSVGYFNAHSNNEQLHYTFIKLLREVFCRRFDSDNLTIARDPEKDKQWGKGRRHGTGTTTYYGGYGTYSPKDPPPPPDHNQKKTREEAEREFSGWARDQDQFDTETMGTEQHNLVALNLAELIERYPDVVESILTDFGISPLDFAEQVYNEHGVTLVV